MCVCVCVCVAIRMCTLLKSALVRWNINGVRAGTRTDGKAFKEMLNQFQADIVCLQETKVTRKRNDAPCTHWFQTLQSLVPDTTIIGSRHYNHWFQTLQSLVPDTTIIGSRHYNRISNRGSAGRTDLHRGRIRRFFQFLPHADRLLGFVFLINEFALFGPD